jgi:hypothetical protein
MAVILFQMAIETYSGYTSLVAGWGDLTLLTSAPRFLILEPFVDGLCKFEFTLTFLSSRVHNHHSGIVCAELLRLADLEIQAYNPCQNLLRFYLFGE